MKAGSNSQMPLPEFASRTVEATLLIGDRREESPDLDACTTKSLEVLSQIVSNSGISEHARLSTRNTTAKKDRLLTLALWIRVLLSMHPAEKTMINEAILPPTPLDGQTMFVAAFLGCDLKNRRDR
jgi:hypothetical protein